MADGTENSGEQSSPLRTLLWAGAAVAALVLLAPAVTAVAPVLAAAHPVILGAAQWGLTFFAGTKALNSHQENKIIDQENAERAAAAAQENSPSRQQQVAADRAAATAPVQDDDGPATTRWRDAETSRRAAYAQTTR